jgi:hypothetical protein
MIIAYGIYWEVSLPRPINFTDFNGAARKFRSSIVTIPKSFLGSTNERSKSNLFTDFNYSAFSYYFRVKHSRHKSNHYCCSQHKSNHYDGSQHKSNHNPTTNDTAVKIAGNTSGNIANWGFVAQQGEWIYYCNSDEKMYKVKTDGSSKTLIPISDDEPRYLNVVNDWIFYLNVGQKNNNLQKIYKIKTDGTDRTLISNDISKRLSVEGDWIYYVNRSEGEKIYKVKTDGTGRTPVSDQAAYDINIAGDWVYYNFRENYNLYRVKTDGTGGTLISNDNAYHFNVVGDWIYYFGNDKLYRIKTDGTNSTLLSDKILINGISIAGDWIYYQDNFQKNNFYKIKTDGTEITKID